MKKILLLFTFFFSVYNYANSQVKFECVVGEKVYKENCAACLEYGATVEYFSGLLVKKNGTVTSIYNPFQIWTKGSTVTVMDWKGNRVSVNLRETTYSSMYNMLAVINNCQGKSNSSIVGTTVSGDSIKLVTEDSDYFVGFSDTNGSNGITVTGGNNAKLGGDLTEPTELGVSNTNYLQITDGLSGGGIFASPDNVNLWTGTNSIDLGTSSGISISADTTILNTLISLPKVEYNPVPDSILTKSSVSGLMEVCAPSDLITLPLGSNILFVSTEGDNATAVKGDLTKPYREPWTAAQNMVSGDMLFVFPGIYSMGNTASTADFKSNSNSAFALWNGTLDTAYFYFMPGTKIVTTNFGGALFSRNEPIPDFFLLEVKGGLSCDFRTYPTTLFTIMTNSGNVNKRGKFVCEVADIEYSLWNEFRINGELYLKANKFYFDQGATGSAVTGFAVGINNSTTNARKSTYTYDIGDIYYWGRNNQNSNGLLQWHSIDSAQINFKCANLRYTTRISPFKFRGFGARMINSQINLEIGNAYFEDVYMQSLGSNYVSAATLQSIDYSSSSGYFDTTRTAGIILLPNGSGGSSENNHINLTIGNLMSSFTLFSGIQNNTNSHTVRIGNYRQMRNCPLLLVSASDNQAQTGMVNIHVDNGFAVSPFIVDTENHYNYTVSGRYEMLFTGNFFEAYGLSNSKSRNFVNARFIVPGSSSGLYSQAGIDINVMSSYTNVIGPASPNITENIDGFVRNPLVR